MKLGFIGEGNFFPRICTHLVCTGHEVHLADHSARVKGVWSLATVQPVTAFLA